MAKITPVTGLTLQELGSNRTHVLADGSMSLMGFATLQSLMSMLLRAKKTRADFVSSHDYKRAFCYSDGLRTHFH